MLGPTFDFLRVEVLCGLVDGDGRVPLMVIADEANRYKVNPKSVNKDANFRGQLKHWNLNERP